MEWVTAFFIDIIKFTVSGSLIFLVVYLTLRPVIERAQGLKLLELKKAALETTLPLRLQAYERVVIFVERINPSSLLLRNHATGITIQELQQILIAEVRNEYQHNISQQIYVSSTAWSVVKRIKEETLTMINNVAKTMPPDATPLDMSKIVLTHLASLEENPYDTALEILRQDIQKLF